MLEISPGFRVTKTPVSQLTSNTKRGLQRKFRQANLEFQRRFAESSAPGQGAELLKLVNESSSSDEEDADIVPDDLKALLAPYENSNGQGKLIILSLIGSSHSRETIMSCFGCTRYKVDMARKLKA